MNIRSSVNAIEYDAGLRSYLTSIYNWMILGLVVSAGSAFAAHTSGLTETLKGGGPMFWLVVAVPFLMIFFMARNALTGVGSVTSLGVAFLLLATCEGLSLSITLERYTGTSLTSAFLTTAVAFSVLSLWGYTTRRNLTGMGTFFLVALIGLIVAMLLGMVFHSSVLNVIVSAAGVLIFAGLVAYDTQTMRANFSPHDSDANARMAIWHALDLYLDFINLMLFLLRFIGVNTSNTD